jgi:hypothetical protein
MQEIFRTIKGYEGFYQISNFGKIISLPKTFYAGWRNEQKFTKPSRIISSQIKKDGYIQVGLTKNKTQKIHALHLLVWDNFGDLPRNGHKLEVDHIDENKQNNRIDNLQILTTRENSTKSKDSRSNLPIGVSFRKDTGKFTARITVGNKYLSLGCYKTPGEASNAYQAKLSHLES